MIARSPSLFDRAVLRVARPEALARRAGGLTALERHLFTAARAGLKSVWIEAPRPEGLAPRLPPDLEVRWRSAEACPTPYVALSADHFVRVKTLAEIVRRVHLRSTAFHDEAGDAVIEIALGPGPAEAREALPADASRRLESPAVSRATTSWLMAAGTKSQDGFMARNFDRHLSLAVSRLLLDTPVTPNMMTVFSTLLGLLGAAFFLGSSRTWYVPGALLVLLHSVLDGCDGELARVRFQESAFGSDLDFWGDNLVHLALFTCLGLGFWRTGNGVHTLGLSAVADLGVLASAWTAWGHRRARRRADVPAPEAGVADETGDGFQAKLARLENALAQRDFLYLLVLLAVFDDVYEFLWAAAIGGLLYFAIMLYLRRVNEHEQARQPHPAR